MNLGTNIRHLIYLENTCEDDVRRVKDGHRKQDGQRDGYIMAIRMTTSLLKHDIAIRIMRQERSWLVMQLKQKIL